MKLLITGGAGYIGSHTVIELIAAGHQVVIVDNLINSKAEAVKRLEQITSQEIPFHEFDISDADKLNNLFQQEDFDGVLHFAGLKAVGESVAKPLHYYRTNMISTIVLCETMQKHKVKRLIFSSSATVYGNPASLPLLEDADAPAKLTNPYGQTKAMIEHILQDLVIADPSWQISILRYFNPVGAHESGLIGEDPKGIPNNLVPYISKVAVGELDELTVTGNDFDTPDGTGVRDYIHVVDLAKGHVAALEHLPEAGAVVYNLGTGAGTSVLEMVTAFSEASGKDVNYSIGPRRPGDIAACYCDPSKAEQELNWKAEYDIARMCADTWRWQNQNPRGYDQ